MPKHPLSYDAALSRMTALCSSAEHCEQDLRERMRRAEVDEADADRVISYLYDEGYISTSRYCHAFVRDKMLLAHWGRVKITQALRTKGLPQTDIGDAVREELDDDEHRAEYARIMHAALTAKARTLKDEDTFVRRAKLLRFGASRGYTPDELYDAIDAALE